jgi:membrane-bound lytic murein transglycosylase D
MSPSTHDRTVNPSRLWWVALLATAACHAARPNPAPAPVVSAAPSAVTDSVLAQRTADSLRAVDTTNVAQHDVTSEALNIFGDTATPPADSATPTDSEPSWDIDVHSYETHSRVAYFVNRYQHAAHDLFEQWIDRSGRYDAMIRSKLHAAGLPEDLTYLALIESGYDPDAYSHAAAVGIWQFMASTARGVGLRVDWWVDERRDPVRSTDGAVKFLGYLNEQFGSLYLAAAAYYGGPGRVARGLSRYADELEGQSGNDAFFALADKDYLRGETRDYVPRLIAAALVAKDPRQYGFDPHYDSAYVYDSVRVGPATPLAAVAQGARVPVSTITSLNPEILRGMTPPGDSFFVRVPVGTATAFDSSFAALPHDARVAYTRHDTRRNETLLALARRAGVSVKQLRWYNPKLKPNRHGRLAGGQTVIFPTEAVVAAARDVPDPSIERYGSSSRGTVSHVVRRGESLGLIARHYHTTVSTLMRINGLRKSMIFPGQVIVISGSRRRTHHTTASRRASTSRHTARPAAASSGGVHVVRQGETLTSIARDYDTSVSALRKMNGIQGDYLREGQKLLVGNQD